MMHLNHPTKTALSVLLMLALSSCSLFSSGKQTVRIVADDPNAAIYVNGEYMGRGKAVATLRKNKSAAVTARVGNKRGVAVIDSELSATGVLDLVGGILFLVPFAGFLSGGAYQLDQDTVPVHLN